LPGGAATNMVSAGCLHHTVITQHCSVRHQGTTLPHHQKQTVYITGGQTFVHKIPKMTLECALKCRHPICIFWIVIPPRRQMIHI